MQNLHQSTLCFILCFTFTTFLTAQTWNGIGVYELTYREGPVAIGTDKIPNRQVSGQDLTNYKLFVCGGILADEWLVPNATWCDYVFAPNYQLLPLEAVAEHIEKNGHLHNTPSAKTIEENGLKIKDITINQQEKIEEIFLHLIQLNERLKVLETENLQLKAENELIKNALLQLSQEK